MKSLRSTDHWYQLDVVSQILINEDSSQRPLTASIVPRKFDFGTFSFGRCVIFTPWRNFFSQKHIFCVDARHRKKRSGNDDERRWRRQRQNRWSVECRKTGLTGKLKNGSKNFFSENPRSSADVIQIVGKNSWLSVSDLQRTLPCGLELRSLWPYGINPWQHCC